MFRFVLFCLFVLGVRLLLVCGFCLFGACCGSVVVLLCLVVLCLFGLGYVLVWFDL